MIEAMGVAVCNPPEESAMGDVSRGNPLVYHRPRLAAGPFDSWCRSLMSMTPMRFPVCVILQRTPLVNRWIAERWEPVAIELAVREEAAASPVRLAAGAFERWRCGGHVIEFHRSEAEGYFLNTTSPEPKVFVMWRTVEGDAIPPIRPEVVTVSYNEAARLMDGGERVDAVPMLPEILVSTTEFVAANYKPEPKRKVRRNDPFADRDSGGGRRREQ